MRGAVVAPGVRIEGARIGRVVAEGGIGIGSGEGTIDVSTRQDAAVAPPVAGPAAVLTALVPQCDEAGLPVGPPESRAGEVESPVQRGDTHPAAVPPESLRPAGVTRVPPPPGGGVRIARTDDGQWRGQAAGRPPGPPRRAHGPATEVG